MARAPRHPDVPTRDGVSASCVALPAGPWPTLLDFLAQRLPRIARDEWMARMTRGEVLDDEARPVGASQAYAHGGRLYYWRSLAAEPVIPFEECVLFQDDWLLVVDKPHFLPVTPSGRYVQQSLLVRLKRRLGIDTLSPIHRIDRETAGLVLFALQPPTRNAYQALFRERAVHKRYEAIAARPESPVFSHVHESRIVEDEAFFRMREVPGEPNSQTRIELLEQRGAQALYRLEPLTGKRHQLRVHMNALGLPIAGDQFYPRVRRGPDEPEDFSQPLALLARAIAFNDPVTGQARAFESRLRLAWPDTEHEGTANPG